MLVYVCMCACLHVLSCVSTHIRCGHVCVHEVLLHVHVVYVYTYLCLMRIWWVCVCVCVHVSVFNWNNDDKIIKDLTKIFTLSDDAWTIYGPSQWKGQLMTMDSCRSCSNWGSRYTFPHASNTHASNNSEKCKKH